MSIRLHTTGAVRQERETALDTIRAALVEGEQSGPPVEIDFDDYIAGKRAVAERGG